MVLAMTIVVLAVQGSAAMRNPTIPFPREPVQAVRASVMPRLDGRLDDPAWNDAQPITGFIQRTPFPGRPASEATEARVLFSNAALYVGIRAFDTQAERISGRLTRRDERSDSDWVGVHVDTYRDRRTAFQFAVNAAGVKLDIFRFNDIEAARMPAASRVSRRTASRTRRRPSTPSCPG